MALCCVLEQVTYPLLSTGSPQENQSRHDGKIVDWDVKNQPSKLLSLKMNFDCLLKTSNKHLNIVNFTLKSAGKP